MTISTPSEQDEMTGQLPPHATPEQELRARYDTLLQEHRELEEDYLYMKKSLMARVAELEGQACELDAASDVHARLERTGQELAQYRTWRETLVARFESGNLHTEELALVAAVRRQGLLVSPGAKFLSYLIDHERRAEESQSAGAARELEEWDITRAAFLSDGNVKTGCNGPVANSAAQSTALTSSESAPATIGQLISPARLEPSSPATNVSQARAAGTEPPILPRAPRYSKRHPGPVPSENSHWERSPSPLSQRSASPCTTSPLSRASTPGDVHDSFGEAQHCEICRSGESRPPNEIMLCDRRLDDGNRCSKGYHQHCLAPIVRDPDDHDLWYCPPCVIRFGFASAASAASSDDGSLYDPQRPGA